MANYPLNMTAKERQLWYWRKEMESLHRHRNVYPQGSEEWNRYNDQYERAVRTYREIGGVC
jgi:hypothetical protein